MIQKKQQQEELENNISKVLGTQRILTDHLP